MEKKLAKVEVKEVSEKLGKKGNFWSITDIKGIKFNATAENYPEVHAGDIFEVEYTEAEYESNGKMVKSRWMKPVEKSSEEMVEQVFGTVRENIKQEVTVKNSVLKEDKIAAATLVLSVKCKSIEEIKAAYTDFLEFLR